MATTSTPLLPSRATFFKQEREDIYVGQEVAAEVSKPHKGHALAQGQALIALLIAQESKSMIHCSVGIYLGISATLQNKVFFIKYAEYIDCIAVVF